MRTRMNREAAANALGLLIERSRIDDDALASALGKTRQHAGKVRRGEKGTTVDNIDAALGAMGLGWEDLLAELGSGQQLATSQPPVDQDAALHRRGVEIAHREIGRLEAEIVALKRELALAENRLTDADWEEAAREIRVTIPSGNARTAILAALSALRRAVYYDDPAASRGATGGRE